VEQGSSPELPMAHIVSPGLLVALLAYRLAGRDTDLKKRLKFRRSWSMSNK